MNDKRPSAQVGTTSNAGSYPPPVQSGQELTNNITGQTDAEIQNDQRDIVTGLTSCELEVLDMAQQLSQLDGMR